MDFPATPVTQQEPPPNLLQAIGIDPRFVGKSQFDYLVEIGSEQTLRALHPDLILLRRLPVRGVIVTARSQASEFDFISRFFAPAAGIDEDPVTGSAHCALGPYWADRLEKRSLMGYQASARGGVVSVCVRDDGRVILGGATVTVLRGEQLG